MDTVVLDQSWHEALDELAAASVPVLLVAGDGDEVVDLHYARQLAWRYPSVELEVVARAGHMLPITHPHQCALHLGEGRTG